jgi:protein-disulfide isomerase
MFEPIAADRTSRAPPIQDPQRRSRDLKITRREFAIGAGALVLTGAAAMVGLSQSGFGFVQKALAEAADPSPAELMQPGPLDDMVMGDEKAPVTVIEYASMTCPHCAHFHETTYPEMKKRYVDTGKVRFIFREFPLDPLAAAGFMLARCAGKDKYFPLIETLFAQQKDWVVQRPLQPLMAIAKQAGFTQQSFEACLANQQVLDGIEQVRTRASEKLGVSSTPTFFINGKRFPGALTIDELDKQIQPYLKG